MTGNSVKMRVSRVVYVLFLGTILHAFVQEPFTKGAETKLALGRSQVLIGKWNDVGRKLITMAQEFPEQQYDFMPTPSERSFRQQLLHVASANYLFVNSATNHKPEDGQAMGDEYKTKAAVVAFLTKSFEDGAAVIKSRGDAGIDDLLTDSFSHERVHLSDMAWSLLEHSGEHYGQLVVYYRAAGLVPPESRRK